MKKTFTHKMAAKTSWHRYGTKLHHFHPMCCQLTQRRHENAGRSRDTSANRSVGRRVREQDKCNWKTECLILVYKAATRCLCVYTLD